MAGTPTPTQEENDKVAAGETVVPADDGSGPDPNSAAGMEEQAKKDREHREKMEKKRQGQAETTRHVEPASTRQGYATRSAGATGHKAE